MENTPMIRRLLIPLLGAGLILAATAGSALGKCEGPDPKPDFCSQVVVDLNVGGVGGIFHAGTQESVDINVWLGEQPYDATGVVLTFARVANGTIVSSVATAKDQPGTWTADVLLPEGGSWTVVAHVVGADGRTSQVRMPMVQVAKPPALPPSTTPVTPPSAPPTTPILPIALLAAGIAAAALAGLVTRDRLRRRTAKAPAGAGAAASVTADHA